MTTGIQVYHRSHHSVSAQRTDPAKLSSKRWNWSAAAAWLYLCRVSTHYLHLLIIRTHMQINADYIRMCDRLKFLIFVETLHLLLWFHYLNFGKGQRRIIWRIFLMTVKFWMRCNYTIILSNDKNMAALEVTIITLWTTIINNNIVLFSFDFSELC